MIPRRIFEPEKGQRVPIHLWARAPSKEAVKQLQLIAAQRYVVERVAAMPDVHVASGVAVGTVFATRREVVPRALGGDLGCGISAVPLALAEERPLPSLKELQRLLEALGEVIPVGDEAHRSERDLPENLALATLSTRSLARDCARLARRQLGTLGGGNHFLELDRDAGGGLWLLVHSGSRGIGGAIARHHLRVAEVEGEGVLPSLDAEQPSGRRCLEDLAIALDFARLNREALIRAAGQVLGEGLQTTPLLEERLDVHHNFVRRELHAGELLLVHRKGALGLERGERGVIPGSMATATSLVEGKGEPLSFRSCSHGAGRTLSRKEARRKIAPSMLRRAMKRVAYDTSREGALVEEAPQAYRDLGEVLEDEEELVTPLVRLEPLLVLKG